MKIDQVNPELRKTYARIPPAPFHNGLVLAVLHRLMKIRRKIPSHPGVGITEHQLDTAGIRVYRTEGELSGAGLLWVHGGGYIIGNAATNDSECVRYAKDFNMVVVPGAPHAFEMLVPYAPVSRDFMDSNYQFLRQVLAAPI